MIITTIGTDGNVLTCNHSYRRCFLRKIFINNIVKNVFS